ncbi:YARHG domain-containing protein [Capnocytophaga gingivalis]|uniref:YARHG domain-containing protein n=1 Tax=Capnocytophaga gingivalis TaxID=1017 RepID=UPI0028E99284|nr:YARHG domain-containing protein [Capnocytophaga gingivalis]
MKYLYFLSIALFSLNATAQLKDCATCATQVIKEQQISKLSIDELRFLTNDLYARKGYKFKDYEISNYFNEKPWYKPVSDNSKVKLNAVEEQNVKLFQERTAILKADREKLIEALRSLKAEAQKGNISILKNNGEEYFNKVITKIDIDNIHWIKNQGYYSAEIDDFKQTNRYFIWIEGNKVTIQCDENGHSKKVSEDKIKGVYDTNEFEVMESNIGWEFRWDKQKLVFVRFILAG